ncbi:hypothetical protein HK096_006412, partial [Nowakowskiella sp. JEL0078]
MGVGVGLAFGHRPINDMVGSLHSTNVAYIKMWDFDTSFLEQLASQYGNGNFDDQLCVGNEPTLNKLDPPTVVAAFKKMVNIVRDAGLADLVKVTIPHSADMMTNTYPPSGAIFTSVGKQYMNEVLPILQQTGSVFSVNLYTYLNRDVALTNRLGKGSWSNSLFRNMLLATRGALTNFGYASLPIIVGETGWATADGTDANVQYANDYLHHVVDVVRKDSLTDLV